MEASRKFSFFKKPESEEEQERRLLVEALNGTHEQLKHARISFENVSEPELVDASVYEINSLQARYNYLIRKAREKGCEVAGTFKVV